MTDTDIHSCWYYCDRPACIVAQRNELRDKLFEDQAVKTYSGGKPNYTQPKNKPVIDKSMAKRIATQLGWEPKKEWVGLTEDEMLMIYAQPHEGFKYSLGRMVQAKLKEKNNV
jgi:hypothetical protein